MAFSSNVVQNRNGAVFGKLAVSFAALGVLGVVPTVHADDVVRSGTAGNLNLVASWNAGAGPVPGASDVAVWDIGSAGSGGLGADLTFGGVRIAAGEATAVTINGANILTLGASGIDMSLATVNLTIQSGATTTPASGINIGAAQIWNIGAGRQLQVGNSASGVTGAIGNTITKTGLGTVFFNNALNNFAGGVILNAGVITLNTNTVVTSSAVSTGPLGTGKLTINGGTLSTTTTSGRDLANDVVVGGDFTLGNVGTARLRFAGNWDLGNATRNITLTNASTGINNSTEQFAFLAQGTAPDNKVFTLQNGTMRFVAGASSTAAAPSTVSFAQNGGGVNFANNSGITLGANVLAFEGSSQSMGGTNSPKLTLEAGSTLYMASNTQAKSFTANSISGAGLIASGIADAVVPPTASVLTIDGATGSANFSGTIQDNITIFGIVGGAKTSVAKTGANTQTFSGTNSYTGTTTVGAGTLVMGTTTAIAPASAVTVGAGATLAIYKLGFGPSGGVATMPLPTIGTNGKFDVGTGKAVLTGTTVTAVQALVNAGIANNSQSIITSSADAAHNVGYGDVGAGGITVRYTLLGDANLDGAVNFNDFLVLQNSFNQPGVFTQGDFNYDGTVNFNDFLVLQNNFGQSVTGAPVTVTRQEVAALTAFASAVPEPTSLAVLGLAGAAVLRRRRSV
ncbi:MAG: putative outer rane autotransporter [Phycisphaerales bacterium]|nr:putative outer rane autotransporter [Phycisphaerales bacterium]